MGCGAVWLLFAVLFIDALLCYNINLEWGEPQLVELSGYTEDSSQAMEPFLSRDGRWLFWNTRNEGENVSLHWGRVISPTQVQWMGLIGGQANGPVPHLDAVPAMDMNNNFYWVSTRDYPDDIQNLQTGQFNPTSGSIPVANHVRGDFYHSNSPQCCWIAMDQEINADGSLLFYVNAYFPFPPGPTPTFTNISFAVKNSDGTWSEHPRAAEIMASVNNVVSPAQLRYAPSSVGTQALELYFTVQIPDDSEGSGIFVATRNSSTDAFGEPERIEILDSQKFFVVPEAPTLSPDGSYMLFDRVDCDDSGCNEVHIYQMARNSRKK